MLTSGPAESSALCRRSNVAHASSTVPCACKDRVTFVLSPCSELPAGCCRSSSLPPLFPEPAHCSRDRAFQQSWGRMPVASEEAPRLHLLGVFVHSSQNDSCQHVAPQIRVLDAAEATSGLRIFLTLRSQQSVTFALDTAPLRSHIATEMAACSHTDTCDHHSSRDPCLSPRIPSSELPPKRLNIPRLPRQRTPASDQLVLL